MMISVEVPKEWKDKKEEMKTTWAHLIGSGIKSLQETQELNDYVRHLEGNIAKFQDRYNKAQMEIYDLSKRVTELEKIANQRECSAIYSGGEI